MNTHLLSYEEFMAKRKAMRTQKKKHAQEEHLLQCACIKWFRYQYPKLATHLFAVPNGGKRDAVTAAKLKAEGLTPGVADLILLKTNHEHGALLIEMKTAKGRQSKEQAMWEKQICENGEYKYVVCRSFGDFKREVDEYLSDK